MWILRRNSTCLSFSITDFYLEYTMWCNSMPSETSKIFKIPFGHPFFHHSELWVWVYVSIGRPTYRVTGGFIFQRIGFLLWRLQWHDFILNEQSTVVLSVLKKHQDHWSVLSDVSIDVLCSTNTNSTVFVLSNRQPEIAQLIGSYKSIRHCLNFQTLSVSWFVEFSVLLKIPPVHRGWIINMTTLLPHGALAQVTD